MPKANVQSRNAPPPANHPRRAERAAMSCPFRLALFEPDIPQNAGSVLRLAACLGVAVDVIEPCGFVWSDRRLRRAGMDYLDRLDLVRHASWDAYAAARRGRLRSEEHTSELQSLIRNSSAVFCFKTKNQ